MTQSVGRFQVVPHNRLIAPGKCACCGSISGDFLDFGFDMNFYGVVYLCKDNCFREAAEALGFVPSETLEEHKAALESLDNALVDVIDENTELRNALGIIERVRNNTGDVEPPILVPVLEPEPEPEPADTEPQPDAKRGKGAKLRPVKSSNEQRPSSLRDNEDSFSITDTI